jgi:serine/threonine-protein kinase RsbW
MASWSRTFPGRPEQVGQARLFTRSVLAGRPEADSAALVVSELATNAVRHTASGEPRGTFLVVIWARADRGEGRRVRPGISPYACDRASKRR